MDKHLNDLIVGVPNHIESYSNQKVFVREKEDNKMAKRTELKCPLCGAVQMRVKNCKEAELICHGCGASLLISKDEDGSCYVSARPKRQQHSNNKHLTKEKSVCHSLTNGAN